MKIEVPGYVCETRKLDTANWGKVDAVTLVVFGDKTEQVTVPRSVFLTFAAMLQAAVSSEPKK